MHNNVDVPNNIKIGMNSKFVNPIKENIKFQIQIKIIFDDY